MKPTTPIRPVVLFGVCVVLALAHSQESLGAINAQYRIGDNNSSFGHYLQYGDLQPGVEVTYESSEGNGHLTSDIAIIARANGSLGVRNYVANTAGNHTYIARNAAAIWTDRVYLSHADPQADLSRRLVFAIDLDYELAVAKPSTNLPFGGAAAQVFGQAVSSIDTVDGQSDGNMATLSVPYYEIANVRASGTLHYQLRVAAGGAFEYAVYTNSQSAMGEATSDAYHTMWISSITFEDGTTPESQGYTLSFESGMASPNLDESAVPEPTMLTIWSLGAIGCVAYRRRMKCRG